MAYTTINKSTDYFNTKLYTGNASTNAITGVGFQPDWCWIKGRGTTNAHMLFDAVRGVGEALNSNTNGAQATVSTAFTSFDSDGFTVGNYSETNTNSENYVSWNWLANGQGSSNTDGSINTTYTSANTTSGFSIVTYTGTGSNATIGHGLGSAPSVVICKQLNATQQWINYHKAIGATKFLHLNATDAAATSSTVWNDTDPTSSVFYVGTAANCNGSGNTYVAYCFAEKKGFSKFGSYDGNGSTDGTFVYTGFKPAFVLLKNTTLSVENWVINDSGRNPSNIVTKDLFANQNYVEAVHSRQDFLSNGFKFRSTANNSNNSGNTYIYMAFAEAPLVGSNNVPCTAR